MAFRHWVDAVDMQLEMVHGFKHANLVMNLLRRSKLEITNRAFEICIGQANLEVEALQRALGTDMDAPPGEGLLSCSRGSDFSNLGGHDYVLADKTVFLNAHLTGKLNTDLHNRTLGIEHKNGFE